MSIVNNIIVSPDIEKYCFEHSHKLLPELEEIENYTKAHLSSFKMLSNGIQAHFLITISKMLQPKRILEIGTFTGFSAICLTQGMQANGLLTTIEKNTKHVKIAQDFFTKYKYSNIQLIQGNAVEIIEKIDEKFDLIYIDADKSMYKNYYELLLPRLSENGWMLIDNTLWKGLVTGAPQEPITQSIQEFNEYLKLQTNIWHCILPIRDGISVVRIK